MDDDDYNRPNPPQIPERDMDHDHDNDRERADSPAPAPSPPPQPPVEPRRSGRERTNVNRPGNIYGEKRNPVDQYKDVEKMGTWKKLVETPPSHRHEPVPGPSSDQPAPSDESEAQMASLCQEGGVELINFLMSQAVPNSELLPNKSNVREWTYRNIMKLPTGEQKEWKDACREELKSLHKRKVFDLVDRPANRKVIKSRWTFDVKLDGRKKARFVAKGFDQVEGLDFDQIFSPVVHFEAVYLMLALAVLED